MVEYTVRGSTQGDGFDEALIVVDCAGGCVAEGVRRGAMVAAVAGGMMVGDGGDMFLLATSGM